MDHQDSKINRKLWLGAIYYISLIIVGTLAAVGEAMAWAHQREARSGLAALALAYLLMTRVLPELIRRLRELFAARGGRRPA